MTMTVLTRLKIWAAPLLVVMGLMGALASTVPAGADEVSPEALKLARQYVDLTDKAQIFEIVLVQVATNTLKTIDKSNPELEKQASDAITRAIDFYKPRKDDLMNQVARVYATKFTVDELTQIVAFYSSPVGQKLAESNADTSKGVQAVLGVFTNQLRPEFFAHVRADLKAQGIDI